VPRDQLYLQRLFDNTWQAYFSDIAQEKVRVEFGRRARSRLGSISLDRHNREVSLIRLNGLFRDPQIPEFVLQATLVHEITHYAHGFHSPLQQKFRHPHAGGVMRREFAERGLVWLYERQQAWLKQNWPEIVKANFKPVRRRARLSWVRYWSG
jgi:hypothetical protein